MKIGLVLDDSLDKADGVQQYVLALGKWYAAQGHEVHYLVGQSSRRDIPHIHSLSCNLRVRFNQNRMSTPLPAKRRQIRALLAKEKFDVLHIQMPYSPFLAGRIIKQADTSTAVIGTFHIVPASKIEVLASWILRAWIWRSKRRFDEVVSVSPPAQRFAKRNFGVHSVVLPNVVNVAQFRKGRRIRKYADGKINIVFLGRLVERKGCRYLLRAIEIMHKDDLLGGIRVLIGGKGPLEMTLRDFVKKNHLGKVVHFVGFVPETDKADFLATADIAVFPSTGGESFGIVLIEAMAARSCVVMAGDNSGYRSVLHEQPQQLFNPYNEAEFVKLLKHFAFNEPIRKRALAWQNNTIPQYDVARVGDQLLELYEQVIAKKRAKTDNTTYAPSAKS